MIVTEVAGIPQAVDCAPTVSRPGILAEMLDRAGVRRVSAAEALALCGLEQSGLWLPYLAFAGEPVMEGGKPYGRLRLDKPQGSKKYHQAFGTGVHVYLPPGLEDLRTGGDVPCVEGEFKAMSLTEAGFPAIGVSGFFGFAQKGGEALLPELAALIARVKPARIIFSGDSDTALNFAFSVAAVRFAKLVHPIPLYLPRIPLNGPGKGADDCREQLKEGFAQWWQERVSQAVLVTHDTDPGRLAIDLFELEHGALTGLPANARHQSEQRMLKLAVALRALPLLQERVLEFMVRKLGHSRRALGKALSAAEKQMSTRRQTGEEADKSKGREIEHDQPAAVWTRQVWEAVADSVYWYAQQVCRYHEGKLHPQSPAEMVSFLDDPERCNFLTRSKDGEQVASSLTEADARVFLGSWMDSLDLIRTVEVYSNVPVLAWNGRGPVLVNGYEKSLRILAGGQALELPTPTEAVEILVRLLRDYDFASAGDLGRAVALLLSPALAQGGFLGKGRVPLFLVEKNEFSAGGSLLLRLVSHVYGLKPQPISKLDNPDRVREDISRLLLSGAGFIYFDNARGRGLQNLPELESLLTEPTFTCRAPYRHGEADVSRRTLGVSSNGAVFSRDLASRTVRIAIRKRPPGYAFAEYAEGNIEDHVTANLTHYLGAMFSLVRDWAAAGRPAGQELTGFRFGQWERACAWVLQKHFPGLPLLDTHHQEAQDRLADPDHDLLRSLFRLVVDGETRGEIPVSGLAEMGAESGLLDGDEQQNRLRLGKAMKRRFPTDGEHSFDSGRFTVTRDTRKSSTGNGHDVAFYEIQAGRTTE